MDGLLSIQCPHMYCSRCSSSSFSKNLWMQSESVTFGSAGSIQLISKERSEPCFHDHRKHARTHESFLFIAGCVTSLTNDLAEQRAFKNSSDRGRVWSWRQKALAIQPFISALGYTAASQVAMDTLHCHAEEIVSILLLERSEGRL